MTKTPFPASGIFAALWIPTDSDGRLLRAELARNIDFLKSRGVHGLQCLFLRSLEFRLGFELVVKEYQWDSIERFQVLRDAKLHWLDSHFFEGGEDSCQAIVLSLETIE